MAEAKLQILPVNCPECGMRARVLWKASGPENDLSDTVTKCARGNEGFAIAGCPPFRKAQTDAQRRLRDTR